MKVVLFLGDFSISKGVTTIQNSMTSLQTTFSAVNVTVSALGSLSAKLNSDVVALTGLLPSTATSSNSHLHSLLTTTTTNFFLSTFRVPIAIYHLQILSKLSVGLQYSHK
jgi:hypothetical protein